MFQKTLIALTMMAVSAAISAADTQTNPSQSPATRSDSQSQPGQPPTVADMPVSPHQQQVLSGSGQANSLFGMLDINHDGKVAKDEANRLIEHWSQLDLNKDNSLSQDEFAGFMSEGMMHPGDQSGAPQPQGGQSQTEKSQSQKMNTSGQSQQ